MRIFENTISEQIENIFPQKITKIGVGDKPFITSDLKQLKRKQMREYRKKGKSDMYLRLFEEFEIKFEKAAAEFIRKNVDRLKGTNPGQTYNVLKKMGGKPEDECD